MNFMRILLMASVLVMTPGSYAMAQWWWPGNGNNGNHHGGGNNGNGGGNHGAPLPIAGAGLPILAAAGLYYAIRKRRRG